MNQLKQYIKECPITFSATAINMIFFFLLTVDGGSTSENTLIKYGAFSKHLISEGEWWRTIAPMFLHAGYLHFLSNTFAILIFFSPLEKTIGSLKFLTAYFASGVGSMFITYLFVKDNVISVGASGVIYGMLGMYLDIIFNKKYYLDKETKQIILTIVFINIVITFIIPFISISGHIGGLIIGFVVSSLFLRKEDKKFPRFQ